MSEACFVQRASIELARIGFAGRMGMKKDAANRKRFPEGES